MGLLFSGEFLWYRAICIWKTNWSLSGNEGIVSQEDEIGIPNDGYYETDERRFNVEWFQEACQLVGISEQAYEAGLLNEQTTVTSDTYKVKYDYNQMYSAKFWKN